MGYYYINKNSHSNPGYNNEVHLSTCRYMPSETNRQYLGEFENGIQAVSAAKRLGYSSADGCWACCPEAHKG